jgi:hypothetical protein
MSLFGGGQDSIDCESDTSIKTLIPSEKKDDMSRIVELKRTPSPPGPHAWEAVIYLPRDIKWTLHVNGAATEVGPWVSALGETADDSLRKALRLVGLAVVALSENVEDRAKEKIKIVCGAVTHDRGNPTWCKLQPKHEGLHDDGALCWETH